VEFSEDLRAGVVSGQITVTFRLWRPPRVRAGGRRFAVGPLTPGDDEVAGQLQESDGSVDVDHVAGVHDCHDPGP